MPYSNGTYTLVNAFGDGTPPNNQFPPQVGANLTDIATALSGGASGTPFLQAANNLSDVASIAAARATLVAATTTQTDFISGGIAAPAAQDYHIIEYIPWAAVITNFTALTSAGTLTATLKIGTIAVTNGVLTVTSAQSSTVPSATNTLTTGNTLVLTVSSISSPANLSFTAAFTRTLS